MMQVKLLLAEHPPSALLKLWAFIIKEGLILKPWFRLVLYLDQHTDL